MNSLPKQIIKLIEQEGLKQDDIIVWLHCDRGIDGGFIDTYLLLLSNELIIVSNDEAPATEKTFKGFMSSSKEKVVEHEPRVSVVKWHTNRIKLKDIEQLKIVNLVASGLLVLNTDEERAVAAFTNGQMASAHRFVNAFSKQLKGESISSEDLQLEQEHVHCPKCGMIYPEKERQICPKCMKKGAIFMRLLSLVKSYRGSIALVVIFMLLNSLASLAIPYFQGTILFDQALGNTGTFAGKIGLVILLIIIFRTLALLFGILYGVINAKLAAKVGFDLKAGVFASLQRLSLNYFQKRQTGQLMTRVNNDASELQYFFIDGVSYFIVNLMNIIGITVILFVIDWRLALICFLPMPLVVAIVRWISPRLWRLSWRRHRRVSRMNSIISDTMRGTRVVKAFGRERTEIERFQKANNAFATIEQTFNKLGATAFPILSILTQLSGIIIWAIGGWKVIQGEITFGTIYTFIGYMYMLFGPIQFMNNIVGWYSYCMSAAQRIFEIQDAVPDVLEQEDAIELTEMKGDIKVSNISFSYEPNKTILRDVTLHAKPGQMVGVIGRSGAGKSTLVNLISRLYDVDSGEILIDDINVKHVATRSLREQIGIVSQEVYVFMASIAENIAYGNPDCTMEEIIAAAKIANAHDFIENLPDGYDTIVGTGGHLLSGGERQRISIARAVLHNPRILILDEATASLDTETELQIQEALESLIKGRTTIAIAHRLSTLRNADLLVVMEKGKVIESGSHEQLMELEGEYHKLVKQHDEALKMRGVS